MPQAPMPNSGGAPERDSASGGGYLPQGKPGGEILISRAEAAALTAFESEDDETVSLTRARTESGLTADQLRRLRDRAEKLRGKGYTLKHAQATFKPKNYENSDEPGLLGRKELDKDSTKKAPKAEAAKATPKTREANSETSYAFLLRQRRQRRR